VQSATTTLHFPFRHATCNAVCPNRSTEVGSACHESSDVAACAPRSSRHNDTNIRGDSHFPYVDTHGSALALRRRGTTSRRDSSLQPTRSGVQPFASARCSALASSSNVVRSASPRIATRCNGVTPFASPLLVACAARRLRTMGSCPCATAMARGVCPLASSTSTSASLCSRTDTLRALPAVTAQCSGAQCCPVNRASSALPRQLVVATRNGRASPWRANQCNRDPRRSHSSSSRTLGCFHK